ncbi:Uncharacterized protein FKW44_008850 [Caligus rogercresseyi]|uniref:Uncharacterized protein n=1 Tax=Caligus rogercresseyi TaxID=217165 RepID=A0A7T8KGP1_CALRO|nr:Uncharacterized protein FKW44_008850 [Caligus rogercresseyi]
MGEYKYKAFEAAFKLYGQSDLIDHLMNFGSMSDSEQNAAFTTLFGQSGAEGQAMGGRYTSESRDQAIRSHEMLYKTGPSGLLDKTIQKVRANFTLNGLRLSSN